MGDDAFGDRLCKFLQKYFPVSLCFRPRKLKSISNTKFQINFKFKMSNMTNLIVFIQTYHYCYT